MTQVVVEENATHGLDLGVAVGVLLKYSLEGCRQLKSAGTVVVDGPVALGNRQGV